MCRDTSCKQNGAANNRPEGFCSQQIPCNTEDGAPAHRSVAVRDRLREVFGNRIIALNHNNEWPPRSPDLTPCDFFLLGHLVEGVGA